MRRRLDRTAAPRLPGVADQARPGGAGEAAGRDRVPDRSRPDGADARAAPGHADDPVRLTAWVHGRVQGVGFRWWVRARALELGLAGWAANLADGRVEVVTEGPRAGCEALLAALRGPGTPGRVRTVVERWGQVRGTVTGFVER